MIVEHKASAITLNEPGNTPLIPIHNFGTDQTRLFAKLEWCNPWGSVKDRIVYYILKKAEERGEISPDKNIIVEPTSGNTGIAIAGISRALGYEVEIIIPEKVSEETKEILRSLEANVLETPDDLCPRVGVGTDQCISLAKSMVASNPMRRKKNLKEYFMPNQYENFNNFLAHYETTGPEIWKQTHGEVTHFICGVGTGGTITGVGQFLKEKNPKIKVIAVEPQKGHHLQGLRNFEESATPKVFEERKYVVDGWIRVSDEEAFNSVRRLAFEERLYVGPSSGAVFHAALNIAKEEDGLYVMILGDSGAKYGTVYLDEFRLFTHEELKKIIREARFLQSLS
jgi:cysteine synthase B